MQEPGTTGGCPRCGHENEADTQFCNTCGLQIDGLCPSCATQNANATHFCGNCGYDFVLAQAPKPAPPPIAIGDLRDQPSTIAATLDCPRCHHLNAPSAVFCFNCGLPFDGSTRMAGTRLGLRIPAFAIARPGGFLRRLFALFIDGIVVAPIIIFLVTTFTDVSATEYIYPSEDSPLINWEILPFDLVEALIAAVLINFWSTTVGKKVLGMYVLRADGRPTGFWVALVRELAKNVSWWTFGIGFLIAAFREDKRTLHDLIAGTVVVKR